MSDGWIKLYRQLQENPLWTCESFTRGQAWVDLLLLANHKRGFLYVRGNKITVERGQVGWSEKRLSERWKWSRTKLRKFLNDLEEEQQIRQQKNNLTSLITLVSYDDYQKKEQQTEPQKDSRETAEEQQKDTNKNDKKEKNEKEDNTERFPFQEFWDTYGKKVSPKECKEKWAKLSDSIKADIMQHVPKYVKARPEKKYRKDPIRYLKHETWKDELDEDQKNGHPSANIDPTIQALMHYEE